MTNPEQVTVGEQAHATVLPDGVECFAATFRRHTFERHIHDTYAIGVTLTGVQRFWCDGVTHNSLAGHVMVIRPGHAHDGESGTDGAYSYRMAYLPERLISDVLADAGGTPDKLVLSQRTPVVIDDPRLAASVSRAWSVARSAASRDAIVDAFDEPILDLAVRFGGVPLPAAPPCAPRQLAAVIDYLHAHLHRDVRTSELARVAGMSRFRLTREFSRLHGLPLHAYHVHLRLEAAKRGLGSRRSVADVAAAFGFCDQSHFDRRFKGAFGLTPSQWRAGAVGSSRVSRRKTSA